SDMARSTTTLLGIALARQQLVELLVAFDDADLHAAFHGLVARVKRRVHLVDRHARPTTNVLEAGGGEANFVRREAELEGLDEQSVWLDRMEDAREAHRHAVAFEVVAPAAAWSGVEPNI